MPTDDELFEKMMNKNKNISDDELFNKMKSKNNRNNSDEEVKKLKKTGLDYYKILGVEKSASNDEIKKKYRHLLAKYHPDKLKALPEDKRKLIAVKKCHPTKDIRILFYKLVETSRRWAERQGFKYAVESVPGSWTIATSERRCGSLTPTRAR